MSIVKRMGPPLIILGLSFIAALALWYLVPLPIHNIIQFFHIAWSIFPIALSIVMAMATLGMLTFLHALVYLLCKYFYQQDIVLSRIFHKF